mmetsp:Transcript_4832/g.8074  ORF Transcript_4832/g.8074 Transcript_4832/m.8074 type:complete len:141 (+) Transcript_4832:195-617(+)
MTWDGLPSSQESIDSKGHASCPTTSSLDLIFRSLTYDLSCCLSPLLPFSIKLRNKQKQTHPGIGISKKSMGIMNDFVVDMMDKLASEAKHDLHIRGKEKTLREWHLNTATRLVLPGELREHGVNEGTKAIHKFNSHKKKK